MGSIISMNDPPFISFNNINNKYKDAEPNRRMKIKLEVTINLSMQILFKYGMGEKIMKAVYLTKDYSMASAIRNSICMYYQVKEKCYRGESYKYAKLYDFILNNVFKKFIFWVREVIRKNNLDKLKDESQKETYKADQKHSTPIVPPPLIITEEESKESG